MKQNKLLPAMACGLIAIAPAMAQQKSYKEIMNETSRDFFTTEEARRAGDMLLEYQRVTGGWPKNMDMTRHHTDSELAQVRKDKARRDDSTTDNGATNTQMRYLAHLYSATDDTKYRDSFRKAVEYLLSGQYDNGGWPQFWPEKSGYRVHITYNDNAMANTLNLFDEIMAGRYPFSGDITDSALREKLAVSYRKGIDCILATQIVIDGEPTVWCQQHDRKTLRPAKARAYELPSFCSSESAVLVDILMRQPNPDERIKRAVHGAMKWFDEHKLTGVRLVRTGKKGKPGHDTRLASDPNAHPIWARFYDLEEGRPYVCDRDGVPKRRLEEIGHERRNGYSWYNNRPAALYARYAKWAARHDPERKVAVSLDKKL